MRHSSVSFANDVNKLIKNGETFDLVFCTDMINLAEFRGIVDASVAKLPTVIYFHENQLTYPVQVEKERDLHFALSNYTSMIASDQVWFNSTFHKDSFFDALKVMLKRMPDNNMSVNIDETINKSIIFPQAIHKNKFTREKFIPPVHIGWVGRWEFDKNPELFFSVLKKIKSKQIPFKLSVIGENFKDAPKIFEEAKELFKNEIISYGYLDSYEEYQKALTTIDILVSTADHEFFGISVMEAIDSGVYPLLPQKLSYPELLNLEKDHSQKMFFYDGSKKDLEQKLVRIINQFNDGTVSFKLQEIANQYYWDIMGGKLDFALEQLR